MRWVRNLWPSPLPRSLLRFALPVLPRYQFCTGDNKAAQVRVWLMQNYQISCLGTNFNIGLVSNHVDSCLTEKEETGKQTFTRTGLKADHIITRRAHVALTALRSISSLLSTASSFLMGLHMWQRHVRGFLVRF